MNHPQANLSAKVRAIYLFRKLAGKFDTIAKQPLIKKFTVWFRHISKQLPGWAWTSCAVVVAFVTVLAIFTNRAHADSQGPLSASSSASCVDTTGVGTVAWTSPGNAFSNDGTSATASVDGTVSHYIQCANFGFSVPTGSIINGIVVGVNRSATSTSNGGVTDSAMRVVKGGVIGTTDRSTTTVYTTTNTYEDHGTSSDLWGTTWAATDVNASNFGAAFAVTKANAAGAAITANVEHVRITVYYTLPPINLNQASYHLFNNLNPSNPITFANDWGGTGVDNGSGTVQTSDGGYAVTGDTKSYGDTTNGDMFLAKYDGTGALSWSRTWGGTGADLGRTIIQTSDGGYAVTGDTKSYGDTTNGDVFLAKYDSSGTLSWSRTWGGTGIDMGYSVVQATDGGYVLTGKTSSYGGGSYDMFLAKFDSSGTLSWSKTWGGTGADDGFSLVKTSDGGYAVTGDTKSFADTTNGDMFLAKYDSSGTLSWSRSWGATSGQDQGSSVAQTSDGGYVVAGTTYSYGDTTNGDTFLAKYDSSGTLSWSRTWGGSTGQDQGSSVAQTSDGGYVVAGTTYSLGAGGSDMFLAKYDSSGTLSWSRTWGSTSYETGSKVVQTIDGGFAVVGQTYNTSSPSYDMYLAKFDGSGLIAGCTSPTCQSPTPTTTSPTAGFSSITAGTTSPTATTTSPTATTTNPTAVTTVVNAVQPTIDVGSSLAAQNTAATVPGDAQPFRLRMDLGVSSYQANATTLSLKLQYALQSGTCDTAFSGETYADVTATTTVRYYSNVQATNGMGLTTNANDPTDSSNPLVRQTYQGAGTTTFTNPTAISIGSDGMWDFALTTYHTLAGQHYCLRVVNSSGSVLNTYTTIPEIVLPSSPAFIQSNYRWYGNNNGGIATFAKAWGQAGDGLGTGDDYGYSVVQTSDGGYAVTGSAYSTVDQGGSVNSSLMYIAKYDSTGALSWNRTWSSSDINVGKSLVQTSDGGYAVTGSTQNYLSGAQDMILVKYDSTGTVSWSRTWGGTGIDQGYSLVQTSDGGYAITGDTASFGGGSDDMFLAKYDSSGTLSWSRTWGGTTSDVGNSLVQTNDGGYAVTGVTASYGGVSSDMFLAKYDSSGTLSWSRTWGSTGYDAGYSLVQTSDGGYGVTGSTGSYSAGGYDMFLAKYDSSGTLSWSRTWGGGAYDVGYSLVQTSDSGFAVTGYTGSYGAGGNDAFLAKYDSSGTLSWSRTWGAGGTKTEDGYSLVQTSDGGYAVTGYTGGFSSGTGDNDMMLLKFDTNGVLNGCNSPTCQSPTPSTTSPTASTSTPTPGTSSPAATSTTITPVTGNPSANNTTLQALSYSALVGPAWPGPSKSGDLQAAGTPVRLRLLIRLSDTGMLAGAQSFKLQYALRGSGSSCSSATYNDITTSTPIQWYDNSALNNGAGLATSSSDPTDGSNFILTQAYAEANNFTTTSTIYAGQDGMWGFSLIIPSGTLPGKDFCMRTVLSTGTSLGTYNTYPELLFGPTMLQQMGNGKWWDQDGNRHNYFLGA